MPVRYEKDEQSDMEYAVWDSVPIFKQHTDDEGYSYGAKELASVAANNNKRIQQTGDYCPIVAWHTPKDGDQSKAPPIIGYAGPFEVKKMPQSDEWAIYARMKFFKTAEEYALSHPRRSVEIWRPKNDPNGRFIDPIAVLGHETPMLDLGLIQHYSRPLDEKACYEMSAYSVPGGGNSYIPEMVGESKDYSEGSEMEGFTPEQIGQLTQLIGEVVDEKLQMANVPEPAEAVGEEPMPEGDVALEDEGGASDLPADVPTDEEAMVDMPVDAEAAADEDDEVAKEMFSCASKKYGLGTDKEDVAGAQQYMMSMHQTDKARLDAYMKEKASEAEFAMYSRITSVEPEKRYQEQTIESERVRYQREINSTKELYQREKDRVKKLTTDLAQARFEMAEINRKARYSRYDGLLREKAAEGYTFDHDEALGFCMSVSDEHAEKHINNHITQFPKVPTNNFLPIESTERLSNPSDSKHYSRLASQHTQKLRAEAVKQGHKADAVSFAPVLNWHVANKTDKCPRLEDILN